VRALAYIIAGHELHHRRIIEQKYLKLSGETGVPARPPLPPAPETNLT